MRHYRRHRRKNILHLHLEPLEDRTALSGWSTPVTPAVPFTSVASPIAADSTPDNDSTYATNASNSASSPGVVGPSVQPVSSSSTSASTSVASPIAANSTPDNDSTYATNASNSASSPGAVGPSAQPVSSAAAATPASGTYSTNTNSSYSQSLQDALASLANSSYAASYAKEYAAYVAQEAAAALRAAEVQAAHVLLASIGGESAPVTETHPTDTVTETPVTVSDSQAAATPTPIGNGRADGETIIPLHYHAARGEWSAELLPDLEDADAPKQTIYSSELRLAAAGLETREPDLESGTPLAGTIAVDVDALEQRITQFFTHVGSQAQELTSWQGVMNVATWLTAGMAATAGYELARRAARRTPISQSGDFGWQDPRLGLLTGDDAP